MQSTDLQKNAEPLSFNSMDRKYWKLAAVFAAVYFFSLNGLGALPNLSLNFILKDQLKLDPAGMAYFQAITLLAWVVKPLWGFISDAFPVFGYRRKSYLIITSGLIALSWGLLAAMPVLTLTKLLAVISVCYMAYAFQDVVTDGLMIDIGKPLNLTGQFQSLQWCSVYLALILTSLCGGYISDLGQKGVLPYGKIFLITAAFPFMTLLLSVFCVKEEKRKKKEQAGPGLKGIFFKKEVWVLSLFLFFWNFSPSFGAPFFYYSVDTLKFSGSFLGILQAVTSFASLLGSFFFGKYFANLPVRKFLIFAVFAGVAMILFNFIFFLPALITNTVLLNAVSIVWSFALGILNALVFLALLNLAAKVSPEGAGATVFALLMSFYNLGLMGSSAFGGFLFPIVGLKWLILISAAFSLLALLFMPTLPVDEKLTSLERGIQKSLRKIFPYLR